DPWGPRWIWGACGVMLVVAALAGRLLARRLGGEAPSEAEARPELVGSDEELRSSPGETGTPPAGDAVSDRLRAEGTLG
ncbi:MAG TPA: hypothetical protein VE220_08365, partial [Gaiellaceae bacterium]|nr:hypothetical protein [Gaiellaceae bacterium]